MLILLALGCSMTRSGESSEFEARGGNVTTLPVYSGATCETFFDAYLECYYGEDAEEYSDAEVEAICEDYGPEWDATFSCWLAIFQASSCATEEDRRGIEEAAADCPVPTQESDDDPDTGTDYDSDSDSG